MIAIDSKTKGHRTVTFSKGDNQENVKIGPAAPVPFSTPPSSGRKYQGGCNRQQDVKIEFQMNKVWLVDIG